MGRAFSPCCDCNELPGRCPGNAPGWFKDAPLALTEVRRYSATRVAGPKCRTVFQIAGMDILCLRSDGMWLLDIRMTRYATTQQKQISIGAVQAERPDLFGSEGRRGDRAPTSLTIPGTVGLSESAGGARSVLE